MEIYEVTIGRIKHQVQLTAETAKQIRATKPIAARKPTTKARTGKVKVRESSTNPEPK